MSQFAYITLGIDTKYRDLENNTNYIWNTNVRMKCEVHKSPARKPS